MMTADEARIELCIKDVRGEVSLEPVLRVDLAIHAHGFTDGATVMFLVDGSIHTETGATIALGQAQPTVEQVGWLPKAHQDTHPSREVGVRWTLSTAAVEHLELHRQGSGCQVNLNVAYVLIAPGRVAPDWSEPHRPLRSAWVDGYKVDRHQWVRSVLQPWRQATAISVIVALPAAATAEQHAIIDRLTDAQRHLDTGEYRASVQDSRAACELLRSTHTDVLTARKKRDLDEREANVLDQMAALIQAVYDYDSAASHTEPHLREIDWHREHAVLALITAAGVAHRLLSGG